MDKFILQHKLAPGDGTVFTGVVRDLKLALGDNVQVDVRTNFPALFQNNPYITPLNTREANLYILGYRDGIRAAANGDRRHFLSEFHRNFAKQSGVVVPVTNSKPDLHVTEFEKRNPPISGRYWLVFGGGKTDMTTKHWRYRDYQTVVDRLQERGVQCVQSGSVKPGHIHPPLRNITSVVGWGHIRELMWQIYHCEGVICPITCGMHMAAAFDKPCVVIAGGREEPWWEHYTNEYRAFGPTAAPVKTVHRFLHTIDLLECCRGKGCWKKKVVQVNQDTSLCWKPIIQPGEQPLPECMSMISPDNVVDAVMSYYHDGTLPPLETNPSKPKLIAANQDINKPAVKAPTYPTAALQNAAIVNHPVISGKVTIFVLCYGEYFEMQRKCIESIFRTVPLDRIDMRIGLNSVTDNLRRFLAELPITKTYDRPENARKYPLMREMFNDPACPIETPYLLWFDDDTQCVNANWFTQLSRSIVDHRTQKIGMWGSKLMHQLQTPQQRAWFRHANWYRAREFRMRNGSPAPNGDWIHFCTGWFWCLSTKAMRECQIPDARLGHNGGDITIGEQLWQGGWDLKQFNSGKSLVWTVPPGNRRGLSEQFPWQQSTPTVVASPAPIR